MHRIDTPNARPDVNGAGKAGYHLNTDMSGVDPTSLDPAALNAIQEEICTVIESQDIELEKGTNNQLLTAIQKMIVDVAYPVHRTIEFAADVNPNTLWPWTTWVRFAEGRTTVGYKSGDTNFGTIGNTGGAVEYTLTNDNIPLHSHDVGYEDSIESTGSSNIGGTGNSPIAPSTHNKSTSSVGSEDPDPIETLSPYVVTAKWRRTA